MFNIALELDARHLQAPQPMLRTLRAMEALDKGQVLQITTTEPKSVDNIESLCRTNGHTLMEIMDWGDEITLILRK